jgi:hypothetical protein
MAGIINTGKVLNNAWLQGTAETTMSGPIAIDPSMEKQYDYALTSDPILLQERKDTQEKLFEIFKVSPWYQKYGGQSLPRGTAIEGYNEADDDEPVKIPVPKKIEKNDVVDLFYYMKSELDKVKKLNVTELVIAINEFFELNYDDIVNKVLSVPLKSKLYEELWEEHQEKMDVDQERLF